MDLIDENQYLSKVGNLVESTGPSKIVKYNECIGKVPYKIRMEIGLIKYEANAICLHTLKKKPVHLVNVWLWLALTHHI